MDKYKNKYRIPSARAQWWDYGWNGAYFITMVTQNRKHFFGEIEKGKMELSEEGVIAEQIWSEIPDKFPFADLGDSIFMPNHMHGQIILDKPHDSSSIHTIDKRLFDSQGAVPGVLSDFTQQFNPGGFSGLKNPMLNENISRIMQWYKGRCSYEIRKINPDFKWQTRFYDHIIRNEKDYQRISDYIKNNPGNWKDDTFC